MIYDIKNSISWHPQFLVRISAFCNTNQSCYAQAAEIGGPWPLLNLRPLHRIVIFAIENHLSLAKWPPLLSVASSTSAVMPSWFLTLEYLPMPLVSRQVVCQPKLGTFKLASNMYLGCSYKANIIPLVIILWLVFVRLQGCFSGIYL